MLDPRDFLKSLFEAAVLAAQPSVQMPGVLAELVLPAKGRVVVAGAGKASSNMAQALEQRWPGGVAQLGGLVITAYGHAVPCERIEIVEAAHPVPDERGLAATRRMLDETLRDLTSDDLVVCLLSGGGSSLLTLPAEGVSLADKQAVVRELLVSGATISEINCVRKHLSAVKGGRLALACHPARVVTLIISDVPEDDPATVASGPTVPDPTTCADALAVLARYKINCPQPAQAYLRKCRDDIDPKAPRTQDSTFRTLQTHPGFERDEVHIIASPRIALEAAAKKAEELGVPAHILSDSIEGESRVVALMHAAITKEVALRGRPFKPPCVLLSGGETTVTVRGTGSGGRNVEFAAALAQSLVGMAGVIALAADTDGVDGLEQIAGAFVDATTVERALGLGFSIPKVLEENDAHTLFSTLGDSFVTGPTGTNVNDFRGIFVVG